MLAGSLDRVLPLPPRDAGDSVLWLKGGGRPTTAPADFTRYSIVAWPCGRALVPALALTRPAAHSPALAARHSTTMASDDGKKGDMEMIPIPSVPDSDATLANGTASAADAAGAEKRRTPADLFFLNRNRPGSVTQLRGTGTPAAVPGGAPPAGRRRSADPPR